MNRRYPSSLYEVGQEPDPRFSLANGRTFLAWTRTSLAFMAGGVALEVLDVPMAPPLRLVIAVLLTVLGPLLMVPRSIGLPF